MPSNGKAGAAAAGRGGVGVDHPERCANQIIDEIDFGAGQERHRGRIDQHHGAVARNNQIVLGLRPLHVELVLKAGAAAALDADPKHGAIALDLEDFPNAAGRPLADGNGSSSHEYASNGQATQFIWCPASTIVKCGRHGNQTFKG